MKYLEIMKKETQDGIFYFADIGSEGHCRPSFRLWVSGKLVSQDEGGHCKPCSDQPCLQRGKDIVVLPAKAVISQTAKGSWVLRPSEEHLTFCVGIHCGYRGSSSYEFLTPVAVSVPFEVWDSPRGNLGVSSYALISVSAADMPLKYRWSRTGRLYGSLPSGVTIVAQDGTETSLDGIEDGLEDLEELKSL